MQGAEHILHLLPVPPWLKLYRFYINKTIGVNQSAFNYIEEVINELFIFGLSILGLSTIGLFIIGLSVVGLSVIGLSIIGLSILSIGGFI